MEREREMMGFEEKTRTVQDDLDNIAKVGKVTSLQFILYIYKTFKKKCDLLR